MINLEKLVEVGFTLEQATNLSAFFRNVGYLTVGTSALKDGVILPTNRTMVIDSMDTLNATLKASSQEYQDIATVLVQNGNMNPNKGRVNAVIIYFGTLVSGENYGNLVDEFVGVNANWSQLLVNTDSVNEIKNVAAKCLLNNRLFVAQTDSETIANATSNNIAMQLKALNNDNTMLVYHTTAGESLSGGLVGIMANPNLGATGSLYATVTSVTPEDYVATVNTNLENQNVTYYSTVNPVNGGGVTQYGTPIVYGGYMINGEDAKRRYIRYYVDIMLKSRCIDFLKKRLGYEDVSADVLLSMLKGVMIGCQTNGLVKQDSIVTSGDNMMDNRGFEIRTIYPTELREVDETLYNSQTYKVVGYYRDSLTGRKVMIDLVIDPSEMEKTALGF